MTAVASPVRIGRAEPADAAVVRGLAREVAAHRGSSIPRTTTEDRWGELLADPDVTVLVAWTDGVAVGYVSAVGTIDLESGRDIVALADLFVVPAARDAGIGALLMTSLADHCPSRPIRWEVEEGNLRAQRFSLELGAHLRRRVIARWAPAGDPDVPRR